MAATPIPRTFEQPRKETQNQTKSNRRHDNRIDTNGSAGSLEPRVIDLKSQAELKRNDTAYSKPVAQRNSA